MLKHRIISTLQFFDLQDTPLTLVELRKFLLADFKDTQPFLNADWELIDGFKPAARKEILSDEILKCLDTECREEVSQRSGYYALLGREELIDLRLRNYFYGINRERLIRRFIPGICHLPFVRGVGLLGSQALGQQKQNSDIDLLILTAPGFLWLARVLATAYFQVLRVRRHGKKIANRFCLNHYLVAGSILDFDRNFYTAAEYIKMRPLAYKENLRNFQKENSSWINIFFPNAKFNNQQPAKPSSIQKFLERILRGKLGQALEKLSRIIQYKRLNKEEFIVVSERELSFHPNNRKKLLFERFFQLQQKQDGKAV